MRIQIHDNGWTVMVEDLDLKNVTQEQINNRLLNLESKRRSSIGVSTNATMSNNLVQSNSKSNPSKGTKSNKQ